MTADQHLDDPIIEQGHYQRQLKILDLFGTIDYDPDFDHKTQRQARCTDPVARADGHSTYPVIPTPSPGSQQ